MPKFSLCYIRLGGRELQRKKIGGKKGVEFGDWHSVKLGPDPVSLINHG